MHWRVPIIGLLALFVAVSCDQQPVEPPQHEVGLTLSKVIFDSWVETIDATGGLEWVACANDGEGEWVEFFGTADVLWSSRTTPSGNVVVTCTIDYQTDTPFGFVGLSSGDVYNLTTGEDSCRIITKPTGPQLLVWGQANEKYVNQDGEKVHLRITVKTMLDAVGNVKTDEFVVGFKCPG